MTLNQIIRRLQKISEAHKQVRSFFQGDVTEFLDDKGRLYPAIMAQVSTGSISISGGASSVVVRLYFVDLVHVSAAAKINELDVLSDMVEIAKDVIAQIKTPTYTDWRISSDNSLQLVTEAFADLVAGCYMDVTISTPYTQNICQVPTELTDYSPTNNDMNVYDETYIATGTEGATLTIPAVKNKKILFITRGNSAIYKVSNNPASTEYTWDFTDIGLGVEAQPQERFLILYRAL